MDGEREKERGRREIEMVSVCVCVCMCVCVCVCVCYSEKISYLRVWVSRFILLIFCFRPLLFSA